MPPTTAGNRPLGGLAAEERLAWLAERGYAYPPGCFYLIGYVDNVSKVKILGGSNAIYLL